MQTVPDDAAKGFGISASLDAAATEGAEPCAAVASNKHIATADYSHISHHDIRLPIHGRNRSGASVTMSVTSWSDALTGQQCGLYDNNVRNDFCAVQEAFETTCSVRLPATSIRTS